MGRNVVWAVLGASSGLILAMATLLSFRGVGPNLTTAERKVPANAVPIGVLGDSDSASYQGSDEEPPGPFHRSRLQWTEVLARIRPDQVDLGEWGHWGLPRWMSMTRIRDGLGLRWRGPPRVEYRHDLAWSSPSYFLLNGGWRQAERLSDIMDEEPQRWARGVVVIRIGVNDFGKEALDLLRVDPNSPEVRALMDECLMNIRGAVDLIHRKHPEARFVLVGIFDNVQWPGYFSKFQAPGDTGNVSRGLDHFDNGLRAMVAKDKRLAFFDDRAWFLRHWGSRDAEGRPAYKVVTIGKLQVTNTEGDDPHNALLAGGHAGLVWNTLWAQSLIELMRSSFGVSINAVSDQEVSSFVEARAR